jgi:hypothetical protein
VCGLLTSGRTDHRRGWGFPFVFCRGYTKGFGVALHQAAGDVMCAGFALGFAGVVVINHVELAAVGAHQLQHVGLSYAQYLLRLISFIARKIERSIAGLVADLAWAVSTV